ncbi:hypothetical protein [Kordia jejudonensis]|uniref:hypothetical protein n=1 Tax=Kordia jejudonensis TaxID=1348245 RepID=UPI00062905E2|nr:hypothetical protein [Kordia jejudonensis]
MKKKNLKSLKLNKKSVSDLNTDSAKGGGTTTSYAPNNCWGTLQEYCTGNNCTQNWHCDMGTHPA